MTIFYTETISVKEIPKYLPPSKIDYEIIFSKGYKPIKGSLTNSLKIKSFSVKTKEIVVFLHLKIGGTEVKKIQISLHRTIEIREVSLKSTVSKTCEKDKNTCNFDLKLHVYSINKNSNMAVLLSLSEIEELSKKTKDESGYYIHRLSGGVAKASKETIDYINNPSSIKNKYIKKAMEIFKRISNSTTEYPRLIYRDLIVEILDSFLKDTKDPDNVVKEVCRIFGGKVGEIAEKNQLLPFYHVYEALIRKDPSNPGYDKIQHFSYSLGKRYTSTKLGTDAAQIGAEMWDLATGGTWDDTTSDMEANNLGEAYGWKLYEKYHPIRFMLKGGNGD